MKKFSIFVRQAESRVECVSASFVLLPLEFGAVLTDDDAERTHGRTCKQLIYRVYR